MTASPSKCIACSSGVYEDNWNNLEILICVNCGLAWRKSFDLPPDYYVKLNENRADLDEKKILARSRNSEDRFRSIRKFLPQNGICDIGCGDGSFLSILRNNRYVGCWGVEPSEYYYKIATKHQLDVVKGNIADISKIKQAREMQASTLFHVIEHLDDPIGSLELIAESLPKGGLLIVETPDKDAPIQKATDYKNELIYPEHLFYWNKKSLCQILESSGFKILKISHRSFDWRDTPIRVSLMRLWIVKNLSINKMGVDGQNQEIGSAVTSSPDESILKGVLRKLLAYTVRLLGRDDYLLVVAIRT